MARVSLVIVPYDSGQRGVRMGSGPRHLLEAGLADVLSGAGHEVQVATIETAVEPAAEIAVTFDLVRSIADAVAGARAGGSFPLVLAGGCFSAVGTLAGLGPARTGVLWLDAHGDFNTPETTTSGFLDGMALATLTGRCWRGLAASVPGFEPLPDHRLVLMGARDLDAPEEAMASALGIQRVWSADLRRLGPRHVVQPKVNRVAAAVDQFYVHVDLDVLDPGVARANQYAAPDGFDVDDVRAITGAAARAAPLAAGSVTAFDPAFDPDGHATQAAFAIARSIVDASDSAPRVRSA
jgi:arginase